MIDIKNAGADVCIDALVKHLFGGVVQNPDALSDKGDVWFWRHPKDGMLRGEPYQYKTGPWDHQWRKWNPLESIEDAWEVLEAVAREYDIQLAVRPYSVVISTGGYRVGIYRYLEELDYETGNTAPRVISWAAYKVVTKIAPPIVIPPYEG